MSAPVGVLWAKLAVDHAGFASDLNKARGAANSYGNQISRHFDSMGRDINRSMKSVGAEVLSLRGIFGTLSLLTGVSVGGLGLLIKSSLETAEAIAKTAGATGLSTTALQEYRFAADQSGVSVETLDGALKTFAKTLGQAHLGAGPLVEILKKIDPELLKLIRTSGNTGQALDLVFKAMDKMRSASDRAALAAAAFGKSAGVDMTNLLRDGVGGLDALKARANDLGLVLDESLIKSANDAKDKLEVLGAVIKTRMISVVGEALPLITNLAEALLWLAQNAAKAAKSVGLGLGSNIKFSDLEEKANNLAAQLMAMESYGDNSSESYKRLNSELKQVLDQIRKINSEAKSGKNGGLGAPGVVAPPIFQESERQGPDWKKEQEARFKDARAISEGAWSDERRLAEEKMKIVALEPQLITLLGNEAEAHKVMAQAIGKVEQKYSFMGQFAVQANSAMADGLTDAILQSKTLSQTLESVHQALIRIIVQMIMMKTVASAFTLMGMPMPGAWGKGGAFSAGRPLAFGSGAVFTGPTLFPMAKGVGLMGERAPGEALLPLTRIGGDLGVKADLSGSGGGVNIQQSFRVNGMDFSDPAAIRKIMRSIADDARVGSLDALRLAGLLKDQADLNLRRPR